MPLGCTLHAEKRVRKRYLAVVRGYTDSTGTIELDVGGAESATDYEVRIIVVIVVVTITMPPQMNNRL